MKYTLTMLFFIFSFSSSADIFSSYQNPEKAFSEAIQSQKNIVIMFSGPWCGLCKQFKSNILSTEAMPGAEKYFLILEVDPRIQGRIHKDIVSPPSCSLRYHYFKNPEILDSVIYNCFGGGDLGLPSVFIYNPKKDSVYLHLNEEIKEKIPKYLARQQFMTSKYDLDIIFQYSDKLLGIMNEDIKSYPLLPLSQY